MNIRTLTLIYNFCTSRATDYWYDDEINDALNEALAENNITENNFISKLLAFCIILIFKFFD